MIGDIQLVHCGINVAVVAPKLTFRPLSGVSKENH